MSKTVRAERKFSIYTTFLDTTLVSEDEILEGETRKDALKRVCKELEETAAELRKDAESMRGQIIQETFQGVRENFPPIGGNPIPVISKDFERLEIEIDNAQTLEELDAVLNRYVTFPGKLLPQINAKRKQLKTLDI